MEQRSKVGSFVIPDTALERVMGYIEDPRDREAISLVCRRWYHVDALSRKHVTITICYSTSPDRVRRRFPNLESLKLNGKPRASMFNLIPSRTGVATPAPGSTESLRPSVASRPSTSAA